MPDLEFLVIEGLKVTVRQDRVFGGRPSGARVRAAVTKPTLLGALLDFLCRIGFYAHGLLLGALELGAVLLKLFLREAGNLMRYRLDSIAGVGMVTEKLRSARAAPLFQFAKEVRHGDGIVAGVI